MLQGLKDHISNIISARHCGLCEWLLVPEQMVWLLSVNISDVTQQQEGVWCGAEAAAEFTLLSVRLRSSSSGCNGPQPALGRVTPAVMSLPTGFNPSTFHLLKKYFVLCGPLKALNVQINNSTFTIFATTWHHETDSGQTDWSFLRRKWLSLNHMTQILPLPVVLTVVVSQL